MKFKIDEKLPVEAAQALCDAGHDAITIESKPSARAVEAELSERSRREE